MKKRNSAKPKRVIRLTPKSNTESEPSHPYCALPNHYFDRYFDKSASDGRASMIFTREPFFTQDGRK